MISQSIFPLVPTIRRRLRRQIAVLAAGLLASAAVALAAPIGAGAAITNPALLGHFDSARVHVGQMVLNGWAADRLRPGQSINVEFAVTGPRAVFAVVRAAAPRPDVGRIFPGLGNNHGFSTVENVPAGLYHVCASALDPAGGRSQRIGCHFAQVPVDVAAHGHFDAVHAIGIAGPTTRLIQVAGWAIDDNTPTSHVAVMIWLGSPHPYQKVLLYADKPRADLARIFPRSGAFHGFNNLILARLGTYPVCAYAYDTYLPGPHTLLGCIQVTV
jgi:hypothetical protein